MVEEVVVTVVVVGRTARVVGVVGERAKAESVGLVGWSAFSMSVVDVLRMAFGIVAKAWVSFRGESVTLMPMQ